jgi:hypothetical protein
MAFLYVIAAAEHQLGPVKLGLSNEPEKRLKQLQTGHPEFLKIYHQEEASDKNVKVLEKLLHRDINYRRQRGEWFNLSVAEAIDHVRFTLIHYGDETDLKEKVQQRRV